MTFGAQSGFDAADRLAVIDLVNSYGYFLDIAAMDRWADLFTQDAVFEGWQGTRLLSQGLEIRASTHDRRERFKAEGVQRRHILSGHRFDRQDTATIEGTAYYQLYSTKAGVTTMVNIGIYEFVAVRESAGWKFQRLIIRADSGFD